MKGLEQRLPFTRQRSQVHERGARCVKDSHSSLWHAPGELCGGGGTSWSAPSSWPCHQQPLQNAPLVAVKGHNRVHGQGLAFISSGRMTGSNVHEAAQSLQYERDRGMMARAWPGPVQRKFSIYRPGRSLEGCPGLVDYA